MCITQDSTGNRKYYSKQNEKISKTLFLIDNMKINYLLVTLQKKHVLVSK